MKLSQTLFEWALTSAFLILAVAALRALLGKRVSAGLRYALWAVVLVRLLVPVQIFSLPIPAALPELDREPLVAAAPPSAAPVPGMTAGEPTSAAPPLDGIITDYHVIPAPSAPKAEPLSVWQALGWLWLAGSAVMAAAFVVSNVSFARRLRRVRVPLEAPDCPLPVYAAQSLPSPCLFGLARPRVYVTAEAADDPTMLRHVLAHEYTHFRHGDHIWNVLRSIALAVHWWNPLVWLAVVLSRRDCELACDEGALKRLGDGERIAYGRTLLALLTVKPRPGDLLRCATTMTGGQKSVFDRMTRIARAPKRWLWAAAAAVLVTALASVCAFGQAEEASGPDPVDVPELTADLTFSLAESDPDGLIVRIDGTVGGMELTRGAFWYPKRGLMEKYPYGHLSMVYPPFTDSIEWHVTAGWLDAGHTTVSLSTEIMAFLSSYAPSGWWEFAVDLGRGEVTSMESSSLWDGPPDAEVRLYPASISEEAAVKAARIAAKLLTAAEDYYNNNHNDASEDLYAALPELYAKVLRGESKFVLYKNEPPISIDEIPAFISPYDAYMCLQRYAVVDLLGGLGSNETPQVLVYFCGVAGDMAGYLLLWDEDGEVHGEIFDRHGWRNRWFIDLKTDGTFECTDALGGQGWMSISQLRPTAAGGWTLHSQAVRRDLDSFGNEIDLESFMTIEQELTEQEFEQALEIQRAKPDVTWHGGFPLKGFDGDPVPTQPTVPAIDPDSYTFTLDEYGVSVFIGGLDCESACWHASRTDHNNGGMTEPSLSISEPRFLGEAFTNTYSSVSAQFQNGQLRMYVIENNPGFLGSRDFLVDLTTGAVTEQEIYIPEWEAKLPAPPDKVLVDAAQTLAQLMQAASDFYQASLPAPEEGPLPFDTPMKLMFCSGAGAWDTLLTLHPDGSFEGDYHDADMTIEYVCQFHGRFGDIRQVTDASWSLTLEELVLDTKYPVGTEWDEGVIHYISSNPYGFDKKGGDGPLESGAQFMLYTPEAKGYASTDELYGMRESDDYGSVMYQFWTWWPAKHVWGPYSGPLGCYALCNMETGYGFFDLYAWGIA